MRKIGNTLTATGLLAGLLAAPVHPAPPTVDYVGDGVHVITFTTPGVYDFSAEEHSNDGDIERTVLISHDIKGKVVGLVRDKGSDIELVNESKGTVKTSNGITVMKTKHKGYGDLGNGDSMTSSGTRRTEVRGSGADAMIFVTLKIKQCVKQWHPFKKKHVKICSSGGGNAPQQASFANRGDWEVRMELQQPVVGELLGTGSISTNIHSATLERTTQVIVAGAYREEDGTAKLKLTPLFDDGDGPVTILAQVVAGPGVQWPAVTGVLEVKGKLLGQKFNEVVQ